MNPLPHPGALRALLILLCVLLVAPASGVEPAAGTQLGTIPRVVRKFALDPMRPRIYGTTSVNTVIAIDTQTFTIAGEIAIGSNPEGLDISPDGTRLYVANSGSTTHGIGVIDLTNFTKRPSLPTPGFTSTVAAGLNNRLFVTGTEDDIDYILQLNAANGAIQRYFGYGETIYDSVLALTPDRKTLFHADRGISPSSLARYDVTNATPVFKESADNLGSNGIALVVNHAGTRLCFIDGAGQGNYGIALIPTSDIEETVGIMNCGAYPGPGAFSPDDTRFFTTPDTQNVVRIFDTATFVETGSFPIAPDSDSSLAVQDVIMSPGGGQLYVANQNEVVVYATGLSPAPHITSPLSVEAHQNESFSFQVTSDFAEVVFAATGLPFGLAMNAAGLITGTPTGAGDFVVHLTASDTVSGSIAQANLLITVLTHLTVNISGQGTVTDGYAGTTWRKVGSTHVITATPAEGHGFVRWVGSRWISDNPSISVVVTENLELTAVFGVATPLTIITAGPGQVTPSGFTGTTNRAVGTSVSVTAMPDAGVRFIGWTGSITSSNPTLEFTVQPGISLVANFEPISVYAGTYHLITTTPNSDVPGLRASLRIQLGKAGAFTAKLVLGNKRYRFKGDFLDPEGFGAWLKPLTKGLPTTVVHLVLSQVDGIPSITGTVDFNHPPISLEINGYRLAVHSKADPAPQAGNYTWGAPLPNNRPFGSSFGAARISANGAATFAGVLGDGTPFSAGSGVTDTGLLLIEVPLYGRKGSVNGVLQFRDVPGTSDFDGTLNWSWPEDKTNPNSDLITDDLAVVGSRLATLAPGANLLPGDTATFHLWGIPIGLLLRPNNKVVADSSPYALQVQLNAATHAFSGSYFIRDDVKRGRFRGRYLAKSRSTFGQLREVDGETYYAPVTIVIP